MRQALTSVLRARRPGYVLAAAVLAVSAYDADFAPRVHGWRSLYAVSGTPQVPVTTLDAAWQPGKPVVMHVYNPNRQYELREAAISVIARGRHGNTLIRYAPDSPYNRCCTISLPPGGTATITLDPMRIQPAYLEFQPYGSPLRWWPVHRR